MEVIKAKKGRRSKKGELLIQTLGGATVVVTVLMLQVEFPEVLQINSLESLKINKPNNNLVLYVIKGKNIKLVSYIRFDSLWGDAHLFRQM